MQLTFQVTRQYPGNWQPVLNGAVEFNDPRLAAAVLQVSFQPDPPMDSKTTVSGAIDATLSFLDHDLKDEHCRLSGFFSWLPASTTLYGGRVTYFSLQGSTPAKGLNCSYLGQMQFTGPAFCPFPPRLSDLQVIQPTLQQLQNRDMLFTYGYKVVKTAANLILA